MRTPLAPAIAGGTPKAEYESHLKALADGARSFDPMLADYLPSLANSIPDPSAGDGGQAEYGAYLEAQAVVAFGPLTERSPSHVLRVVAHGGRRYLDAPSVGCPGDLLDLATEWLEAIRPGFMAAVELARPHRYTDAAAAYNRAVSDLSRLRAAAAAAAKAAFACHDPSDRFRNRESMHRDQADLRKARAAVGREVAAVEASASHLAELSSTLLAGLVGQELPAPPAAGVRITKIALALAMLLDHPEWTDAAIAQAAGCSRGYLSKNKQFQGARAAARGSGRADLPRARSAAEAAR